MKQIFKLFAVCALAGVPLLYTGCTDYSEDINAVNSRIDQLESGKIASVESQISALQATVTDLNSAKTATQEAIESLKGQIADLNSQISSTSGDVTALQGKVSDLEKKVKSLEDKVKEIDALKEDLEKEIAAANKAIKEGDDAVKTWANQTFETKEFVKGINERLGALETNFNTLKEDFGALNGKYDSDLKISEIIGKITDAQDDASTALGNIAALKEALGVYAEKGKLEAKLDAVDTELGKKLNIADFNEKFDAQLELAMAEDGVVTKAIAAAIKEAKDEIYKVINELKATFNKELRSLVFIPELYVDGIEAVEYTYLDYNALAANTSAKLAGTDDAGVAFKEIDKAKAAFKKTVPALYVNPDYAIQYYMNPSGAEVKQTDRLSFVSNDVQAITKASEAAPEIESFETKDGILTVNMTALGQKAAGKGMASVFALQAEVKRQDGKDTVITSDYANLYATKMNLVAIAYSKKTDDGEPCLNTTGFNHLYDTAAEALENATSIRVKYDEELNIKNLVKTHISIFSKSKRGVTCGVYEDLYPENDFGLSYKFELVDYLSGNHVTSDSQHAMIDATTGVLTPCGVTGGKADASLTGENATIAIGRKPLVLVTVLDAKGKTVLAGYIKVSIVREAGYREATPFGWTVPFLCDGSEVKTTWDGMVDNILKLTKLSKEEFDRQYGLEMSNGAAAQYKKVNGDFERIDESPVDLRLGVVTEISDAATGTTTNIINWKHSNADQCGVYQQDGHTETIWVRYIFRNTTPSTIYEGIYVPLTLTVTKPTGTLGVKLPEYWFENQKNAIINVNRPSKGKSTLPWVTDLGNVWEGNKPVVSGNLTGYDKYDSYLYYFAPVQNSFTVDGVRYVLSIENNKVYDKHNRHEPNGIIVTKNSDIYNYELRYAIDVTRGIFNNTVLSCSVNGSAPVEIATIDQTTGMITYEENDLAKVILNLFESQPASERVNSGLYANIGTVSYSSCNIALPVNNEVNPYYFLRPINVIGNTEKSFTDGTDTHLEGANINLFDMLQFNDWRGQKFVKSETDYTNLWHFAYYGVKSVTVDIDNVTTNMNGGNIESTKLTAKTNNILLSYNTGTFLSPVAVAKDATVNAYVNKFTWVNGPDPDLWNKVGSYNGVIAKLGFIKYINNGSTVNSAFKLRIPVEIGYDWGSIKTYVDVTVNPTLGN